MVRQTRRVVARAAADTLVADLLARPPPRRLISVACGWPP